MALGGLASLILDKKFISVITGLGSLYHNRKITKYFLYFIYSLLINKSNQIWFVSKSDFSNSSKFLRIPRDKVKFIYGSGIDTRSLDISIKGKLELKKIIYSGRIREDKGILDFIKLASKMGGNTDFNFQVMGAFDTNNKNLIQTFMNSIKNNKFNYKNFEFNNLGSLKDSLILVMPSRHEGMPTIILESMANYVIPVATDLPVIIELISLGAIIYSYPPGDIKKLENIIKDIYNLTDAEKIKIMKKNQEIVKEYFDNRKLAEIQANFIQEAML